MVLGMSPLVTSALRLVVIATLFAANLASLCRTCKLPKYSGLLSFQRVTILTILTLNLVYLSVIWAPFTITTFKHNLQDHRPDGMEQVQASSPYMMEYLVRRNANLLQETRLDKGMEESPLGQYILTEGNYYPQQPFGDGFHQPKTSQSDLGESLNSWITRVQDLVTSSFTYSLILTVLVEKIMVEKGLVVGPPGASLCALLLAVTPLPLTLAVRSLASTTDLFALHTPEVKSGYTMYSIICDVHITETYVVGLFLELTVVLLVAAVLLLVTRRRCKYLPEEESKSRPQEENDSFQVEDVACKFVLLTGAGWAWPVKPLLVIILYCISGPHWNNAVCWLANMVVAIPVSFMPLAVFLARPKEPDTRPSYTVKDGNGGAEAAAEEHSIQNPAKTDACSQCVCPTQDVGLSPADDSVAFPDTHKDAQEKRSQIRENLKFYLGTDIFRNKDKKEDEVCILSKQDGNESPV